MNEQNTDDIKLLSLSQVSKILGVSLPTLHRRINEGKIQTLKIGRRTLISKSKLLIYLNSLGLEGEVS